MKYEKTELNVSSELTPEVVHDIVTHGTRTFQEQDIRLAKFNISRFYRFYC